MPGLAAWLLPPLEGTPRLAFSWAHARRKFYDIHAATKSPLAQEALTQIAALYAIEAEMRGQPALVRQQCSRPLVEAMNGWLRQQRIVSGQTKRNQLHSHVAAVELEGGKRSTNPKLRLASQAAWWRLRLPCSGHRHSGICKSAVK